MRADISIAGPAFTIPRRIAVSGTRFEAGEPLLSTATLSSGAASANTCALAAADCVVLNGTQSFAGIAMKTPKLAAAGTTLAQTVIAGCPLGDLGRLRAKGETAASIDTAAELLGLIGDVVLIDYNSTGGADGGELYTFKVAASADTSAFTIVEGDIIRGTLDTVVDPRAYRINNDVS
jgi:hypothetical protein